VKHRKFKLTASVILAALVASLASRAGATERVITIGSKSLLAEAAEHLTTTSSKSVPADVERLATIAAKSLPVEPPTTTGNTLGGLVSNDSTSGSCHWSLTNRWPSTCQGMSAT
jgi:hypothetical protein